MENNSVFVLLAGGKSERMGENKGLLKYKNTYWILEQLNRISKTSINEVFIGLGFNAQNYFVAIPWFNEAILKPFQFKNLSINIIVNKYPEIGSFSTLQTVLKKIDSNNSILINPIDIPILNSEELQNIINSKKEITLPSFNGKNGHPIKLNPLFWKSLLYLNLKDKDSRLDFQLKKIHPSKIKIIDVLDDCINLNINTKNEWYAYLERTNDS